ncbi:MAG: nitroreductase family protein [Aquiluna sp.]|jgi:nitroreductase|nr:nitroreductase family protein [Aquiluna sp.]|tara:strand:+ start:5202 stop:5801 length:600 start_codon:yes stop_codon:yes gene_type:complete
MTNDLLNKPAETSAELHPLIRDRWSPRIFDSSYKMSDDEAASLGEAFRWSPSSSNQQNWHVVILRSGTDLFGQMSESGLKGFNQAWAPQGSAYAVLLADTKFDGEPRNQGGTFFDVGLAASQLVTQTEAMGLKAHYMGGINHDVVSDIVGAKNREVICVIAIGKQGTIENHSPELVQREVATRTRRDPAEIYSIDSKIA